MIIKRILDFFLSITMLIVLMPVLIIIFLLIKIEGDGPAIFKQERLGKNSVPFMILKFRSMKKTAPNVSAHEMKNIDYTTKVGRILRKTSLDELPQLINIVKGEMSFIGPRPFILNEGLIIDLRKKYLVDQLRPGLTGYAQVQARDTIDQQKKFNLDLYYANHVSFKLDMEILYRTLFSLKGK